jgi:nitroreductase
MKRTAFSLAVLLAFAVPVFPAFAAFAEEDKPLGPFTIIEEGMPCQGLPMPARDTMPLGDALAARATHREFSAKPLSFQEIADLLWAANGVNRPAEKKRTAPTAINRQEIDIYVCLAEGACIWNPISGGPSELKMVCKEDLRGFTGRTNAGADNFALKAPVTLVYVVDFARQGMQDRPMDAFKYAAVDCGFVGQNVYLHCAATGLHTVFLGSLDADAIAKALRLPPTSTPLFAQTVGHPATDE